MEPIFTSMLDQDYYKFGMGSFFLHEHQGLPTIYAYKCRDPKIDLRSIKGDLLGQLSMMSRVALTAEEEKWLRGNTRVTREYLDFLRDFRFYPHQIELLDIADNPGLSIRINGSVEEASLWEMPLMYTISELYFRKKYGNEFDAVVKTAKDDLIGRLDLLQPTQNELHDFQGLQFSEFGTRRRLCRDLQDFAVETLNDRCCGFTGTSNMFLAMKHGVPAIGTQAHEAIMLQQALEHPEDSQVCFLWAWARFYRNDHKMIALTDTLGPKKWNKDFDGDLMNEYYGQRHDSGNPVTWAEGRIKAYENANIDPKEKLLLFSDNLTFERALALNRLFKDRIKVSFGIGTHITNHIPSMPEHKALNQVIKIVRANSRPVAKLSDDPMKAQCEDPIYLNYLKHISE